MKKNKHLMPIVLTLCLLFCMGNIVEAQQSPRTKKVDVEAKRAQIQQRIKAKKAQIALTNQINQEDLKSKAKTTKLTPAQIEAKKQRLAQIKANPAIAKKNNTKATLQPKSKNTNKKNAKKLEPLNFDKAKFQENTTERNVKLRRQ